MLKNKNKLKSKKTAKLDTSFTSEGVVITSPLGPLSIHTTDNVITKIEFGSASSLSSPTTQSKLAKHLQAQFDQYFDDPNQKFSLKSSLAGTPFQLNVWHALVKIPVGKALTYGQLAKNLGTSARAVGGALRANPCPILIPCHRIVAQTGLGGFSGQTSGPKLSIKAWLLKHEGLSF